MLAACQEQILHNLSETEVNKILTRLDEISVAAEKVKQPDGSWGLSVPKADALKAIKYLNETRILPESGTALSERPSMITSREEQRFRYERAISREIELTLANIPGVLEARVHLNLPVVDPLFGQPLGNQRGTGSVLLVVRDSSLSREQIAALVSGASGIPSDGVSVLFSQALPPQPEQVKTIAVPSRPTTRLVDWEGHLAGLMARRSLLLPGGAALVALGLLGFLVASRLRGVRFRRLWPDENESDA